MAEQDNVDIARKLYEHWNAREFDRVAELVAADGEIVLVGSDTRFRGPDGSLEFSRMWADGFPDGKVTIDRTVVSGDTVVVEFTGKGTHTGTLRGSAGDIPATVARSRCSCATSTTSATARSEDSAATST